MALMQFFDIGGEGSRTIAWNGKAGIYEEFRVFRLDICFGCVEQCKAGPL